MAGSEFGLHVVAPAVQDDAHNRTRFAIILSLVVLVPYYTFMMITAFNPAWLAQPISDGSISKCWILLR